jgi:hypothetical protein
LKAAKSADLFSTIVIIALGEAHPNQDRIDAGDWHDGDWLRLEEIGESAGVGLVFLTDTDVDTTADDRDGVDDMNPTA